MEASEIRPFDVKVYTDDQFKDCINVIDELRGKVAVAITHLHDKSDMAGIHVSNLCKALSRAEAALRGIVILPAVLVLDGIIAAPEPSFDMRAAVAEVLETLVQSEAAETTKAKGKPKAKTAAKSKTTRRRIVDGKRNAA